MQVNHLGVHARQAERKLGETPQRQVACHLHEKKHFDVTEAEKNYETISILRFAGQI